MIARFLMLGCLLGLSVPALAEEELPPAPPPPPPPSFHAGVRFAPGESLSSDPAIRAKKPVLIYYANDVRTRYTGGFDRNVRALTSALENHQVDDPTAREFLTNLANRIPADVDGFNFAVDEELDALLEGLARDRFQYAAGLAIFRNNGNSVSVDDRGWEVRIPWECSRSENSGEGTIRKTMTLFVDKEFMGHPFWPAQPLTSPYALITALEAVKLVFPEETHRYFLVIKSRGDKDHFLLPWLEGDVTQVDPKLIAEKVLERRDELTREDGVGIRDELAIYGILNDVLRKLDPAPAPLKDLSFQKDQLLESLAQLGGGDPRRGMYFTCLLCDTVDGGLELSDLPKLRKYAKAGDYTALNLKSVGQIYTRQGTIASQPLPYDKLFFQFGPRADDFHDQVERWLTKYIRENQP